MSSLEYEEYDINDEVEATLNKAAVEKVICLWGEVKEMYLGTSDGESFYQFKGEDGKIGTCSPVCNIEYALWMIECLQERVGGHFSIKRHGSFWEVSLDAIDKAGVGRQEFERCQGIKEIPKAITIAALRAVGVDVGALVSAARDRAIAASVEAGCEVPSKSVQRRIKLQKES